MDKIDIVIIGAGVVGLAIGAAIACKDKEMYILEKEEVYGQGTSSRNSEVVHAGIYYPKGTLKADLCVKGNPMIYVIQKVSNVPNIAIAPINVEKKSYTNVITAPIIAKVTSTRVTYKSSSGLKNSFLFK